MNIYLNGDSKTIPDNASIAELAAMLDLGEKRYAIEVNDRVIPRSQHQDHCLREGDAVEIVQAIGGG